MRILFFAGVRDATGRVELEWPDVGAMSVEVLWARLLQEFPSLAPHRPVVRLARNGSFVGDDAVFEGDDEVALIPPVSGG